MSTASRVSKSAMRDTMRVSGTKTGAFPYLADSPVLRSPTLSVLACRSNTVNGTVRRPSNSRPCAVLNAAGAFGSTVARKAPRSPPLTAATRAASSCRTAGSGSSAAPAISIFAELCAPSAHKHAKNATALRNAEQRRCFGDALARRHRRVDGAEGGRSVEVVVEGGPHLGEDAVAGAGGPPPLEPLGRRRHDI